jgi:hypothetical protein
MRRPRAPQAPAWPWHALTLRTTTCDQVAALLVHVFEACAAGDYALAAQLAAADTAHGALEACQRDMTDKRWTLDGGAPGGGGEQRMAAEDVSPDALADALGGMGSLGSGPPPEPELEPLEDGWERAPARKGRRAQPRAAEMMS